MKTITRTALLAILLLAATAARAQTKVGTTAAPFLGIGVGPRATAMGGAFVALGSDVSALYWNPGAVSRTGMSEIMASHTNWLVSTNLNWVGLAIALDADNAIGLSLTQLDYGEDIVTTETQPDGTGERWSAQDVAFAATYSRNLTDRFSIGGSVKYISQRIWNETASAFAVDIGLLFITPFNGLRLGMSLSNFGSDMQMQGRDLIHRIDLDPEINGNNKTIVASLKTDAWELPLFFRVGVAYDIARSDMLRLSVAADAIRPNDNDEYINIGGEFAFQNMFFVRVGYKSLFLQDSEEGLTAGIGVLYPLFDSLSAAIDYTYQDFGIFKSVNTFTMSVTF